MLNLREQLISDRYNANSLLTNSLKVEKKCLHFKQYLKKKIAYSFQNVFQ